MTNRVEPGLQVQDNILHGKLLELLAPLVGARHLASGLFRALLTTGDDLQEQGLLGGEGGVEGALGESSRRGDVTDRRPLVALGSEHLPGSSKDPRPGLLAPTAPTAPTRGGAADCSRGGGQLPGGEVQGGRYRTLTAPARSLTDRPHCTGEGGDRLIEGARRLPDVIRGGGPGVITVTVRPTGGAPGGHAPTVEEAPQKGVHGTSPLHVRHSLHRSSTMRTSRPTQGRLPRAHDAPATATRHHPPRRPQERAGMLASCENRPARTT